MREGTLWLFYICKYLELIFLIVITILMIAWGVQFLKDVEKKYPGPKSRKM